MQQKNKAMKTTLLSFIFIGILGLCLSNTGNVLMEELPIGSKALNTDYKMQNVFGKVVTLNSTKGENGLLVIFSCNTCPYVEKSNDRYTILAELCKEKRIGMVAVNSNEAYRSDKGESLREMKHYAISNKYSFNYVLDKNNKLADAYGATRTPHVFLFDKDLILVYKGAIDSDAKYRIENVKTHFLQNAINNMISGKKIEPNATKAIGCSIKRI